MSGAHLSKDFFELIKNIGECKSKQEEEKIVSNEVTALRQRLSESPASIGLKRSKEAIVRVMYVEMLGQSADFGHIHAVNMTQQTNLLCKRVGYLACSLCLHPEHELITLLVNTMRRDLKSSNHLEVCAALIAVSKLVNNEIMPAVIECIAELLEHTHEVVRKKAVMALHRLHLVQPGCLSSLTDKLRRALCDRDPAVMGASLHILHVLIDESPAAYKDLVPSFVSILKQITEHRLPSSFDYHRMPAPWIQIKLLQVLASLGVADQRASEHQYEVLYDVLKRADTGINIGYAVVYECVRTVTRIYPNVQLMETAANHISRFVAAENHNLKYLGIKALASIVQVNQKYALEHQMVVVECMEDPDETLKRKTLDLLFRMTSAANVAFVVDRLLHQLRQTSDVHFRAELAERITQLAERYAPDNGWFITTMNAVFELGGDVVQAETAHNLLRLIAEGSGEDDEADTELRLHAVSAYYGLLQQPHLPDVLMKVVAWTLGEYGYLSDEFSLEALLETLCDVIDRQFAQPDTRCWLLSAITKLCAQMPAVPEVAMEVALRYSNSKSVNLQQYCAEFLALAKDPALMADVLPVDSSCDDLELDPALRFLDDYVEEAVRNGAARYLPPSERADELQVAAVGSALAGGAGVGAHGGGGLRFSEYANPAESVKALGAADLGAMGAPGGSAHGSATGLNTSGVAQRWGADGYREGGAGSAQPAPLAPPAQQPPAQPLASAAPAYAAPTAAAAARAPAAMSEREKMAAALFSGIGAGQTARSAAASVSAVAGAAASASAAAATARGSPATVAKAVTPKEKKPKPKKVAGSANGENGGGSAGPAGAQPAAAGGGGVGDLLGDLLDLDLSSPPPAATAMQPSPSPSAGALDLLSLGPELPPAPQPPHAALLGGLGGAVGGLAGLQAPAPAPVAQLPLADGLGALGGLGGLGGMAPLQPSLPAPLAAAAPVAPLPAASAPPPAAAVAAGGALAGAGVARAPLASDGCLELSMAQSLLADCVSIELLLASRTHSPLRNLSLAIEPPAQLSLSLAQPAASGGEVRGHRLTIPLLHGGQTTAAVARLVCADVPTPQMRVSAFLSYMEDQLGKLESRTLSFHLTLTTEHVLRPQPISTQQFGEMWGAHGSQRKFTVATKTISTPQAYMRTMESQLHFAPVQVIGAECIMCATVIGVGATVLVHAKVGLGNGTAIEVTVRTKDNRLGEGVQRLCTQALAS